MGGKDKSEGEGEVFDGPLDEAEATKHDLPEGGKRKGKGKAKAKPTWGKAKGKGKGMCKWAPWMCGQCGGDFHRVAASAVAADGADSQTSVGIDMDKCEGEGKVLDGPADEAEAAKHDLPEGGRCKGKGKAKGKPSWGKAKGKGKGMCKWAPWVCGQCGGDFGRAAAARARYLTAPPTRPRRRSTTCPRAAGARARARRRASPRGARRRARARASASGRRGCATSAVASSAGSQRPPQTLTAPTVTPARVSTCEPTPRRL
eukprot:NODE_688_length_1406_cov_313.278312.p2 GENE.NODE_688_length_1406_cov_313.278312~~NODE_688_length_1406_cov_313.278312.p2  ORF type:complete len:260 (-),score=52.43 NODE_688_length_1406_cov_313.278312:609-1388(-)